MKTWLFLAGAYLSACQFVNPTMNEGIPPQADSTAMLAGQINDSLLGYSLQIPNGWSATKKIELPVHLALSKNAFQAFQPNITLLADSGFQDLSIESLLEGLVKNKTLEYGADFILISRDTISIGGHGGGVLEYSLHQKDFDFHIRQILVVHSFRLLLLSFIDRKDTFWDNEEAFQALHQSLRLFDVAK